MSDSDEAPRQALKQVLDGLARSSALRRPLSLLDEIALSGYGRRGELGIAALADEHVWPLFTLVGAGRPLLCAERDGGFFQFAHPAVDNDSLAHRLRDPFLLDGDGRASLPHLVVEHTVLELDAHVYDQCGGVVSASEARQLLAYHIPPYVLFEPEPEEESARSPGTQDDPDP